PATSPKRGPGKAIWFIGAFAAIFAVAALLMWRRPARAPSVPAPPSAGAPEDDYFADGIADAVRGKLTSLPGLEVIARASSTPYKKTNKSPQEIAKELSANYLLTATVRWDKAAGQNRVQVSPELVEV